MKKFALFVLLLAAIFTLTSCGSAYSPKIRIPWMDGEETLVYDIKVMPDSAEDDTEEEGYYNYVSPYNDMDYPVKPDRDKSGGEYTSIIRYNAPLAGETESYTIITHYYFMAVYSKTIIPEGFGEEYPDDSDFVFFESWTDTEAVYSGRMFGAMVSSEKTIKTTEVTQRKVNGTPVINDPVSLDYRISAEYKNGNYEYEFLAGPAYTEPYTEITEYEIAQSGSFAASGIDNEILLYYIRAVEMTVENASQISMSVNAPDPYSGKVLPVGFGYNSTKKIPNKNNIPEAPFNAENEYNCVMIVLSATGEKTGHGIRLYYALNDSPSLSIPSRPERHQQKLIRMQQSYLQYDLKSKSVVIA